MLAIVAKSEDFIQLDIEWEGYPVECTFVLRFCVIVECRFVESHLNRDENDFELNVASAGLDSPLKLLRQYKKNVGRTLKVETMEDETVEGVLTEATDDKIVLQRNLTKKQKKEGVSDLYECTYDKIKTAKIMIKF